MKILPFILHFLLVIISPNFLSFQISNLVNHEFKLRYIKSHFVYFRVLKQQNTARNTVVHYNQGGVITAPPGQAGVITAPPGQGGVITLPPGQGAMLMSSPQQGAVISPPPEQSAAAKQ